MPDPIEPLINTPEIELWPGGLLRARRSADARLLARARRVLRRKRDGRYLAVQLAGNLRALVPGLGLEPGIDAALAALRACGRRGGLPAPGMRLAPSRLLQRLQRLGLDAGDYATRTGLELACEPARLEFAGFDRWRRPLWLASGAARAWQRMRQAALADGVLLEAISGYRSHDYQLGIFERKLARGLGVAQILAVNAAPGFSEHHLGCALDIGTPGEPPAEERFERTTAFDWLHHHAGTHGFRLSYPRGNPHGIVYEPWHWRWHAPASGARQQR